MFGITNFETFLVAALLLNVSPGADTMYILGRSISQGKKAGVLSAIGISAGSLFHCIIAAFGLSLLIAKSAIAFSTIKYVGASYLIFLGIKALINTSKKEYKLEAKGQKKTSNQRIFVTGMLTNILNPKVALFFLAFLPQFIDPSYELNSLSFMVLGFTFITTGTIWCVFLAMFSAQLSGSIQKNFRIQRWLEKITGGLFIALGIKLALSEK